MEDIEKRSTLNFEISKELNELIEAERQRLQISKADFIRMRLVEYFEAKKALQMQLQPQLKEGAN